MRSNFRIVINMTALTAAFLLFIGCGGGGGPTTPNDSNKTSAEIGPTGGSLNIEGATLTIPEGALSRTYTVTLKQVSTPSGAPKAVSKHYQIGVNSAMYASLEKPLSLKLNVSEIPEGGEIQAAFRISDVSLPLKTEINIEQSVATISMDWLPGMRPLGSLSSREGQYDLPVSQDMNYTISVISTDPKDLGTSEYFRIESTYDISLAFLEILSEEADKAVPFLISTVGFESPKKYSTVGKPYVIIITDLESSTYGETSTNMQGIIKLNRKLFGIDKNQFSNGEEQVCREDCQDTICHEFFHLIQFAYYHIPLTSGIDIPILEDYFDRLITEDFWFSEGTAAMVGGWGRQHLVPGSIGHQPVFNNFADSSIDYPLSPQHYTSVPLLASLLSSELSPKGYAYQNQYFFSYLTRKYGEGFIDKFLIKIAENPLTIIQGNEIDCLESAIKDSDGGISLKDAFHGFIKDFGSDGCLGYAAPLMINYEFGNDGNMLSQAICNEDFNFSVKRLGAYSITVTMNQGPGYYTFNIVDSNGESAVLSDDISCYWVYLGIDEELQTGWNKFKQRGELINENGISVVVGNNQCNNIKFFLGNSNRDNPVDLKLTCRFEHSGIPSNPTIVSVTGDYIDCVDIEGDYAYVAGGWQQYKLDIVNINPPESAHIVKSVSGLPYSQNISVGNGYVYIVDYDKSIWITDVDPIESSNIVNIFEPMGAYYCFDLTVENNLAYVCGLGLAIFDMTNPVTPILIRDVKHPPSVEGIDLNQGYAYLADRFTGLHIVDIDPPETAYGVGELLTPETWDVAVQGNYACVVEYTEPGSQGGLVIIDIQSKESPEIVGSIQTPIQLHHGIDVQDGFAYVLGNSSETALLYIVDIDPPGSAYIYRVVDMPAGVLDIVVVGPYAYVASIVGLVIVKLW